MSRIRLFTFLFIINNVSSFHLFRNELIDTAYRLSKSGKGILAADESTKTIGKRFESINIDNTIENRNNYRKMLLTTPNLNKYIAGTILYDETLNNNNIMNILEENDIIPGIKVDLGLKVLPGTNGETWCTGLDTLGERAEEYYNKGARFAKWRSVFIIGENTPSQLAINENAWGLARYARTVQNAGLVPIVEPEILMDGDHSIGVTSIIQKKVLRTVYSALKANNVLLEGTLLKPSMTLPGIRNNNNLIPDEIAEYTLNTLISTVPKSVPGIVFLSGGMSEKEATVNLNAINKLKPKDLWNISFSYGRALQNSCLKEWNGKAENIGKAQEALIRNAKANYEASKGMYQHNQFLRENDNLFVENYSY
jgi:fructose-bisphosphate aldolase class I